MPTIELTDEQLEAVKEKLGVDSFKEISSYEDLVGEKMFFRTVTYHALGEVKKIVGRFVYLKNASWIADTGRFGDWIKDGVQTNSEIEPVGEMFLNLDTVVDFFTWRHKLPTTQK
jgi:hypothetical protein